MKKYLIKVNGSEYEVEVEEIRDMNAAIQNSSEAKVALSPAIQAPVQAPKATVVKNDAAVPVGASTVTAPMPGTILNINVSVGDMIKKGQVLLILEAMKMENEIVAPAEGKIAAVNVARGASVNAGDVLISIA